MSRNSTFFSFGAAAVVAVGVSALWFQGGDKKEAKPPAAGAMEMQEMPMPKPGPEHAFLKKDVGTWDATMKMWMDPKGAPMESKGVLTARAFGEFWLEGEYKSDFMGMPFVGHDLMGYDSFRKKYVGSWHDVFGPQMLVFEGTYDEKTRTLTCKSEMNDPMDPSKIVKLTMTTVWKSDDVKVFTMREDHDGKAWDGMVVEYRRKK